MTLETALSCVGQKNTADERRNLAERLFDEHGNAVFRFALRLCGNQAIAEDITSDTILVALQKVKQPDGAPLTRNYLFGITVNKWRRLRPAPVEPISELISAHSSDIDQLIDLEQAFRKLPPALQESFILVKAEGLTSKEAAEILKIPQGTVQARTHEAVHRMRSDLTDIPRITPKFSEAKP